MDVSGSIRPLQGRGAIALLLAGFVLSSLAGCKGAADPGLTQATHGTNSPLPSTTGNAALDTDKEYLRREHDDLYPPKGNDSSKSDK